MSGRATPEFPRVGIVARRCFWSAGFLGDLPFHQLLHSGAAAYSPRFTLIGSQEHDVKSHPDFFWPPGPHLPSLKTFRDAAPIPSSFLQASTETSTLLQRLCLWSAAERQRVYNFVPSLSVLSLFRALSDELRRPESVLPDVTMTSSALALRLVPKFPARCWRPEPTSMNALVPFLFCSFPRPVSSTRLRRKLVDIDCELVVASSAPLHFPVPNVHLWAAVAERLACSPPTMSNRVQYPAGTLACGNRAGRCRWSAGFLGDLPFSPSFHSADALNSPQSPSSALKASLLRAAQISSLTHSFYLLVTKYLNEKVVPKDTVQEKKLFLLDGKSLSRADDMRNEFSFSNIPLASHFPQGVPCIPPHRIIPC
ncbi:hypothetical protein PR048_032452 [Dryococelus australis]|uniref:Uncharacterized protein n=1 Tax=Dryococelus australis TaxID=614101 RepID=A0ABQ9G5E0_9NEOP|nr:hypothetical protein PR048_032452 [Dryococelus australis]